MVRTLKPLAIFLLAVFLLALSPIVAFSQEPTCAPATAVAHETDQSPIKIKKVIFTGYTVLSPAEQEEISAALSKGSYYKSKEEVPSALSDEVRRQEIRKLYGVQGYINISIIPTTQIEKGSDRVVLTLEMDEGPQFRVGKVEVLGADEAKSRQFVSQSGLITGSIYDSSRLQKAFVSESDGFEAMEDSVMRTINEADSTVDFKVDLRSCASVSHR